MRRKPRVVTFHTHSIDEAFSDIALLGRETATEDRARLWIARLQERLAAVRKKAAGLPRRRVFCVEWFDPVYTTGHWVPEMVEIAGGMESLSQSGKDSRIVDWNEVIDYAPERIVGMPCGMKREQARREFPRLSSRPGWETLPAVRSNHVFLADGSAYFNGAGPRLVDGVEILAEIAHPEVFSGIADRTGFERIPGGTPS